VYQKELRKDRILLGIGVAFTLFIFFGASASVEGNIFEGIMEVLRQGDFYVLVFTLFYPLGLFYNFRRMLGLATEEEPHTPAESYYTVKERNTYHSMQLSARIMRFAIIMTIGSIPGVFRAFYKLHYLKKNQLTQ